MNTRDAFHSCEVQQHETNPQQREKSSLGVSCGWVMAGGCLETLYLCLSHSYRVEHVENQLPSPSCVPFALCQCPTSSGCRVSFLPGPGQDFLWSSISFVSSHVYSCLPCLCAFNNGQSGCGSAELTAVGCWVPHSVSVKYSVKIQVKKLFSP